MPDYKRALFGGRLEYWALSEEGRKQRAAIHQGAVLALETRKGLMLQHSNHRGLLLRNRAYPSMEEGETQEPETRGGHISFPFTRAAASQALPAAASGTLQALLLPQQWEGIEGIPIKNVTKHRIVHSVPAPRGSSQRNTQLNFGLSRGSSPHHRDGTGQSGHSSPGSSGFPGREGPRPQLQRNSLTAHKPVIYAERVPGDLRTNKCWWQGISNAPGLSAEPARASLSDAGGTSAASRPGSAG